MPLVLADRVKENSSTTGTGTFTLTGAQLGFQSFAVVGNANTTYYTIQNPGTSEWEVGVGTYTSANTTIARTTVLSSSNANAVVNFSAGTKDVFVTYPAERAVYYEADGGVVISDNSTATALRITQTGSGNALVVEDSANPDATPFVVDANGRAIIGTTTVQTIASTNAWQIQNHGNSTTGVWNSRWSADANSPTLVLSKSRSATIGSYSTVSSGDLTGTIRFFGDDGTAFVENATITGAVDGTPGTNDMPGRLTFSTTADGASSPTERMRIDSAGNVGIGGTAAAGQNLRISKTLTGSTIASGISQTGVIQSDVTSQARYYSAFSGTAAASFTLSNLYQFIATQGTFGLGSTVTNQYGFFVESTLTGATNNYGFYGNIASGTGRWNFYANGTADNAFAGNTRFGGLTAPTVAVDVTGTVRAQAAATQDAVAITGRAGGTGSFAITLTPATLSSSTTLTLPNVTDTVTANAATQTLTNKRVTPRVSTTTSSATPTINTDTTDQYGLTAQTVDITSFTTNLSGTPTDGQKLWIYIVGTAARAITWGASFEASTIPLPTTTVSTNRLDVGFVWNAVTSKWRCVATA